MTLSFHVHFQDLILLFIIFLAVLATVWAQKLTVAGAVTGGIIAIALYRGIGVYGLLLLGVFFLLGTAATSWNAEEKIQSHLAQKDDTKRTMGQVLANGGVAGLIGSLAIFYPQQPIWWLLIAGSFSAATADTLSSELGSVYGRRFYNILTFKKDNRGLDGVVSIEGLLVGICGSSFIAILHCLFYGWNSSFAIIVLSGTAGNLIDSVLGATMERRELIGNNAVNFLNTLTGALAALLLSFIL